MPAIKAKPVRLIDVLGNINEQEIVVITFNHGRNSCSNTVAFLENEFNRETRKWGLFESCTVFIANSEDFVDNYKW